MKKALFLVCTLFLINLSYTSQGSFTFAVQNITPSLLSRMVHTWHAESPVPLEDLRHITLNHYDFEHAVKQGELIVHKEVVDDLHDIFKNLFEIQFPIQSIRLVDEFDGSDLKSMHANNTSAFYARKVAGTDRWSNHSFGCAVDINPLLNPYSSPRITVLPQEGAPYLDRTLNLPGMIIEGSYIYQLFIEKGWEWGGECFIDRDGVIDRHHFQKIVEGLNKRTNE